MAKAATAIAEDVGNILSMEHVNVFVPDQRMAEVFYIQGLGFTRDPFIIFGPGNMWVNVGEQQFHLPNRGVQVIPGHTGIVTPDLEALKRRLKAVEEPLADTKFAWSAEKGHVAVACPWGNRFHCYAPNGKFGQMALGIPYVEFMVKPGTADGIALFYQQVLRAPAKVNRGTDGKVARVGIGLHQELLFRETTQKLPDYDGHHIAIYIANFSEPYEFFKSRNIVMQELAMSQFRFKEIVNPKTGELLLELEHEVRSLRHPMFRRDLLNRDPAQGFMTYVRGHDTLHPLAR